MYIIYSALVLRPWFELTDHTEYAFTVAFVSVDVVCQRNKQTCFVDITRKLDNSLSAKTISVLAHKCGISIYVRAKFIDKYIKHGRLFFSDWMINPSERKS